MIRWICRKCNHEWLYPISICIDCKAKVEKITSDKFKVVGFTTVNIPSRLHTIVPYNILLLEDELGSLFPKKTMRHYNLGETYEFPKGEVSIIKVKYDLEDALRRALESIEFDPAKFTDILIKPDFTNVNPEVVYSVIKIFLASGVKITLTGSVDEKILAKKGFDVILKKYGVDFVDSQQKKPDNEYNLIINIPVFCHDDISNRKDKIDISLVPNSLTIADTTTYKSNFLNILIAGRDPAAVYATYLRLRMKDLPEELRYLNPSIGGDELEACRCT